MLGATSRGVVVMANLKSVVPVSMGFMPIGLNQQGEDDNKGPSMKSFIRNSKPYFAVRDSAGEFEEGRIKINEDGVVNTYYLPGAKTIDDHTSVEYRPPYRFYLMKEPSTDYGKAELFYKPKLIGKTFTVDMNLDQSGCGCNLNFYLVNMPVAEAGQDHDHYCDAQCFPGLGCCAEFDMNEGNDNVQQITNHACTGQGSYPGHPDWQCHKWGDPEDKSGQSQFSVGRGHTIDSDKPFTFSQKFDASSGSLIITTTMSQEERSVTMSMGPSAQLDSMWKDGSLEKGMAFVTGYWFAPDMNWLDGEECGSNSEHCNQNPAYISNWRITTNGMPIPTPAPAPAPGPGPDPSPTPAPEKEGKCCWEHCEEGCHMDGWCSESKAHCDVCGGKGVWCSRGDPNDDVDRF